MRISDWSSDVCSSDLLYHSCCFPCVAPVSHGSVNRFFHRGAMAEIMCATVRADHRHKWMSGLVRAHLDGEPQRIGVGMIHKALHFGKVDHQIGEAACRERG